MSGVLGEVMTNDEFTRFVIEQQLQGWIPIATYRRMFPEEKANTIHLRVHRGHWKRGVHYSKPPGGGIWVCLPAIREWAKSGGEDGVAQG